MPPLTLKPTAQASHAARTATLAKVLSVPGSAGCVPVQVSQPVALGVAAPAELMPVIAHTSVSDAGNIPARDPAGRRPECIIAPAARRHVTGQILLATGRRAL